MNELDILFGGVQHYVTIRGVEYEVRRFTIAQLGLASSLANAAIISIQDLPLVTEEDLHLAIGTAVLHLVCDTDLYRNTRQLITSTTSLHNTLAQDLTLAELTEVLVSIVQCNAATFDATPQSNSNKKVTWSDVVSVLVKHGFSTDDVKNMTPEQLDAYLGSIGKQHEPPPEEVKPNKDGWM